MSLDASSCGICGFPLRGPHCDACGEARGSGAPGEDVPRANLVGGAQPENYPGLESAFVAWRQNDHARMVGQCLVAVGVESPQVTNLAAGPGWSFVQDSTVIYISFDRTTGEMAIEAPLVKLVVAQRVPMMRALLGLNADSVGLARLCLRDDIVVLRFADRLENLSPPKLVAAIRDVALRADGLDTALADSFAARTIGPEARRQHMAWSFLGTPRTLQVFGRQPRSEAPTTSRPSRPQSSPPPAASWPPHAPSVAPPIAPPIAPSVAPPAISYPPPRASSAPPPVLDYTPPRVVASSLPAASWPPRAAVSSSLPPPPGAPVDVFELLRHAHDLLLTLIFTKRGVPALLLARSAVFLVQGELTSEAPGATSLLLRDAVRLVPSFWQAPVDRPGLAAAIEPIATLFESSLRERRLGATELPVAIENLRTALDAKAHLRALNAELAKSPPDVPYRYVVLLGIFAELLVRAPLPPAMVERLRGLMAKARGLGETPQGVNVLEDALRGVIA